MNLIFAVTIRSVEYQQLGIPYLLISRMGTSTNGRSTQGPQQHSHPDHASSKNDEDIPACQSCRRKKARCSREQPCSHCIRFNVQCVYDDRRLKPGLRAGAVEQLCRRMDTLEDMFLGQNILWKQVWEALRLKPALEPDCDDGANNSDSESPNKRLLDARDQVKQIMLQQAQQPGADDQLCPISQGNNYAPESPPPKRRKVDPISSQQHITQIGTDEAEILGSNLIFDMVEFYFANIHHWIPILHVRKFREQIRTQDGRHMAVHILHAIVASCSRFSDDPRLGDDVKKAGVAEQCRQKVILSSMESFSVENLQALVIIAFDTVSLSDCLCLFILWFEFLNADALIDWSWAGSILMVDYWQHGSHCRATATYC